MASRFIEDAVAQNTAAEQAAKAASRQAYIDQQRAAQEAAVRAQADDHQEWWSPANIIDKFWMDDFQKGPFSSDPNARFGPDFLSVPLGPGPSLLQGAWQESVGDKVNAATTAVTKGYDTWSQAISYASAMQPGGAAPLSWDEAGKVANGEVAVTNVLQWMANDDLLNSLFGHAAASMYGGLPAAVATSIGVTDPANPALSPNFDLSNAAARDRAFRSGGVAQVTSGAAGAAAAWFLDPLVIGGKALKVFRFGSEAMGVAGRTNMQVSDPNVQRTVGGWIDEAIAHVETGGTDVKALSKGAQKVVAMATNLTRMGRGELENYYLFDKSNPFRNTLIGIADKIDNERDALVFAGAAMGEPRYIQILHAEQHAAADALTRARAVSANERVWLDNMPGFLQPAVRRTVLENNIDGARLIEDLSRRDKMLQTALREMDGTNKLTSFGSASPVAEKISGAWAAGKANRDMRYYGRKGQAAWDPRKKDELPLDVPYAMPEEAITWDGRTVAADKWDVEKLNREARLTMPEMARLRQAQELKNITGPAGYERVFQLSSDFRRVRLWSWLNGQHASGMMTVRGIGLADSTDELNAVFGESKLLKKDIAFTDRMKQIWVGALNSGSPEARMNAVHQIEREVSAYFANHYGVDVDTMDKIYTYLQARRADVLDTFSSRGKKGRVYGIDPDDNSTIILDPVFQSQLESRMPMLDLRQLERTARIASRGEYKDLAVLGEKGRELTVNLLDEVASLWKASVLLRLGYTQRNVVEGWLRSWAVLGTMPGLAATGRGAKNTVYTNRAWNLSRRRAASQYARAQRDTEIALDQNRTAQAILRDELRTYQAGRLGVNPYVGPPDPANPSLFEQAAVSAADPQVAGVYRLREDAARNGSNFEINDLPADAVVKVGGQRITPITQYRPTQSARSIMRGSGIPAATYYELNPADAGLFHRLIRNAKRAHKFGASVTVYEAEKYAGMRLFVSADGKSGFALSQGDDIVSVFAHPSTKQGAVHGMHRLAIEQGGRRSDAFDTVLPGFYATHGMRAVSRVKFDPDYAPEGWDYSTYSKFNNGQPDVVGMAYDPNYVAPYQPGQGAMVDDYGDMLAIAGGSVADPHLASILDDLDRLTQDAAALNRRLAALAKQRSKNGKRKVNETGAFAGENAELYRQLSGNQQTVDTVLRSNWGRQAEASLDGGSWTKVKPDEPQYAAELSNAVKEMRNDDAAVLAMEGASPAEIASWIRSEAGREYRNELRLRPNEVEGRAVLVHDMVHDYLPTEQARRLAGRDASTRTGVVPDGDELITAIGDRNLLAPIHGRQIKDMLAVKIPGTGKTIKVDGAKLTPNNIIHYPINKLFSWIGTLPETALVRQPFYNTVWQRRIAQLETVAVQQGRVMDDALRAKIERNAHAYALQATNNTLYTIVRYSNPAHLMRFIVPFFPAWENSIRVWAGIIVRDPSVAARANMLWQIPNKMGWVVDRDGNKVESDSLGFLTGSSDQFVVMPQFFAEPLKKLADSPIGSIPIAGDIVKGASLTGLKSSKGSFNVVSPGQTPWLPGFGPMVTAPIGFVLASKPDKQEFLRKFLGETLYQQIAPFGEMSANPFDSFLPSAGRKAFQLAQGEDNQEYLNVLDAMTQQAMVDWYKSGGNPVDKPTPAAVREMTDQFYKFSTLASLTLPMAVTRMSKYQPMVDKWNQLKATPGMTYTEKVETFLTKFGDAYLPLTVSTSKSLARDLDPTMNTYNVLSKNTALVEKLGQLGPEAVGILGASAPLGEFDQGVYNWYLNTDMPGQPGETYKSKMSASEMQTKVESAAMWRAYNAAKALRDDELKRRGGLSLQAKANADLAAQWRDFTDVYMVQKFGSAWSVAYNDFGGKQGMYLEGVTTVLNDPAFARSEAGQSQLWQQVRAYMQVREEAIAAIRNGADSSVVNDQWEAIREQARFASLEFSDFFDNYLANDKLTIGVSPVG